MRSLVYVVLAGCFVSFIIAKELRFEVDKYTQKVYSVNNSTVLDVIESDICEDPFVDLNFDEIFLKVKEEPSIDIETIEVYEIEEEVTIGFDTKKYLPRNFNPYEKTTQIIKY